MTIEIRPVTGKRDLRTFIKLPWRLYRDSPNWVPPLLMDRSQFQRVSKQCLGPVWLVRVRG
jgi:hypothetical protein